MNVSKIIKKLKSKSSSKKNFDLDIHGSCVSRDIFRFDVDGEVAIGKYFARNSFISSVSEPFPEKIDLNISSQWKKRIVETDLRKELFKQLSEGSADYLLIDFIDERLSLMKYKKSIFTVSGELLNSNFLDDYDCTPFNKFDLDESFWKRSMDDYLNNLVKIYDEEKIIIHETYFVDSFLSKTGEINPFPGNKIDFCEKNNKMLKEYYNYIKIKLPNANMVNIIKKCNLAYENHMWGLAPVHYEDIYYKHALKKIISILDNNRG
jgi:hypothetical protein